MAAEERGGRAFEGAEERRREEKEEEEEEEEEEAVERRARERESRGERIETYVNTVGREERG